MPWSQVIEQFLERWHQIDEEDESQVAPTKPKLTDFEYSYEQVEDHAVEVTTAQSSEDSYKEPQAGNRQESQGRDPRIGTEDRLESIGIADMVYDDTNQSEQQEECEAASEKDQAECYIEKMKSLGSR